MINDILRSLGLLTKNERRKVIYISSLQALTSFLDLFGILLAGLIAGIALERDNSGPLTQNISKVLGRFYSSPLSWTSLLGFLILAALILLATKSITNIDLKNIIKFISPYFYFHLFYFIFLFFYFILFYFIFLFFYFIYNIFFIIISF
jgi:hypothetical protein